MITNKGISAQQLDHYVVTTFYITLNAKVGIV